MVKYEYYYASGFHYPCTDMHLCGQSFTPLQAHTIKKVVLKLYRVGNPGIVTVHIYNTLAHIPVGAPLCSGTTNANTLTTDTDGEEREILVGAGVDLDSEVLYAIVLVGTALGDTHWIGDPMGMSYDRGTGLASPDGGITWYYEAPPPIPAPDKWFEEWGEPIAPPVVPPTVTTNPATDIGATLATLNGLLVDDGGEACEVRFQWGETIAYGNDTSWQGGKHTTDAFEQIISALTLGQTYHFRAQAKNSAGTADGADRSFTTLVVPPTVTTNPATDITPTLATLNGTLNNGGGEACGCGFEWGETEAYEHGATSPQSKTTGEDFSQAISGLNSGTTYHFRAFATNSAGTSYGADRIFTTIAIYIIYDVDDLQAMEDHPDAYYELANDIDASATSGWNGGLGFNPIGRNPPYFTGYLDGKNYTISGLYINRPSNDYIGLFGYINFAEIKNIKLAGLTITGHNYVGGLAGRSDFTTVQNCSSTGNVSGHFQIGGIVGHNFGIIHDCHSAVNVSGDEQIGGLVGRAHATGVDTTVIYRCYSTGNITGGDDAGGLIGIVFSGNVERCYSTGNVSGDYRIGGLFGCLTYTALNCYARGDVSGDDRVGGLAGEVLKGAPSSRLTNCYSTGEVIGNTNVGGLVGIWSDTPVTSCFWDKETSGQATSAAGTGKTTAEMKTESTFIDAGWDFATIWNICGGVNNDYPCLLDVTPSCVLVVPPAYKGNIIIDQLIYQHAERMRI